MAKKTKKARKSEKKILANRDRIEQALNRGAVASAADFDTSAPESESVTGSAALEREFVPLSLPNNTRFALLAARAWQDVDDSVTDEEALAKGFITPEMIELILSILNDLIQNCLSNRSQAAWRRVAEYVNSTNRLNRMGDDVRFGWMIDRWLGRLGYPRDKGDIVEIRQAVTTAAATVKEDQFKAMQTEILFLTV